MAAAHHAWSSKPSEEGAPLDLPRLTRPSYRAVPEDADSPSPQPRHSQQPSLSLRPALRRAALSVGVVGLGVLAVTAVFLLVSASTSGYAASQSPSASAFGARAGGVRGVLSNKKVSSCEDNSDYSHTTLKLVQEETMFALFGEQSGSTPKYEASDVIAKGDYYYVICDSSWSIYRIRKDLPPFSAKGNTEIMHVHKAGSTDQHDPTEDSSYEGIYYDAKDELFYLVRESLPHPGNEAYHAIIEEVRLVGDGESADNAAVATTGGEDSTTTSHGRYTIEHRLVDTCETEDLFNGDSKGLEGVIGLRAADGTVYLLGLCEGNYCQQEYENGFDKGHGVIIVFRKIKDKDGSCAWVTVRHISLPDSVDFTDYSAIAYNPSTGLVAITSQEDARLWVGPLTNPKDGHFDPEKSEFGEGQVYDFPPNDDCDKVYCNIEGVHWISDNMVVAVSDEAKDKGRQDFRCKSKDQSVHIFMVPEQ